MLTGTFLTLVSRYTDDKERANDLWLELFSHYAEPGRHYHTISHLENMAAELTPLRPQIDDWDAVLFALFYHDVIYKPTSLQNEAESARFARQRLQAIGFPADRMETCAAMILATKEHLPASGDTAFLLDADMAVLGAAPDVYRQYADGVREEYSVFPDLLYNTGRKKILRHFLSMDRIFSTEYFYDRFERRARLNIQDEIDQL